MYAFPATRDRGMPVDFLRLSLDCVKDIEDRVRNSNALLTKSQSGDLFLKLVETIENVTALISNCGESSTPFIPAIRNLYKISEKAKRLVCNCSNEEWRDASLIFQLRNDESFQEILLEMGLCYHVIREQAEGMRGKGDPQIEDLRKSSTFSPASEEKVRKDREDLREVLVRLASTISSSNHREKYLAKYLLRKLDCPPEHDEANELGISTSAILLVEETEPPGTWELNGLLGVGSGACGVLKAKWLGIPCAKKVFCTEMQMPIFLREAGILSRLSHPNIVNFYCCSKTEKGQCFIGMELMQMSLSDLIKYEAKKVRKSFPLSVALDIFVQIARGMCYLHDFGIAHRDLKPSNVVVNRLDTPHLENNFCVKLGDFGMSKTKVEVSKSNTISVPDVGTTKFRAPEVYPKAQNPSQGDKGLAKAFWLKADVYSFGVTCAEILSLTTQFEGIDLSNMCRELKRGERLPSHCLVKLVSLLTQCWCEDPRSRPRFTDICITLEEVRHDLSRGSTSPTYRGSQEGGIDPIGYDYIEEMLRKYEHHRRKHSAEQPDSLHFTAFDEKDAHSSLPEQAFERFQGVVYPQNDPDAVEVRVEDIRTLNPSEFLNATIIEFYIKYLLQTSWPRERLPTVHVFKCFFFQELAQTDTSYKQSRAAIERVKKWTKGIPIFEKDYIFIPVNQRSHWSLIIICHPGHMCDADGKDRSNDFAINSRLNSSFHQGVNICAMPCPCVPVSLHSEGKESPSQVVLDAGPSGVPVGDPYILHLDPYKGTHHTGLEDCIKNYLSEEWKERNRGTDPRGYFDEIHFLSANVPQQDNQYDCGIFVLHYVELFLKVAPPKFSLKSIRNLEPNFLRSSWFKSSEASAKRLFIQQLIVSLAEGKSAVASKDAEEARDFETLKHP